MNHNLYSYRSYDDIPILCLLNVHNMIHYVMSDINYFYSLLIMLEHIDHVNQSLARSFLI